MRVLVTGAAGFVGNALVRHLIESRYDVRAMIRCREQEPTLRGLGAEPVLADLCAPESLVPAVQGVDTVFHIAALFRQAGLPESEFFRVNVDGTRHLLDACIEAGVTRFLHCSTVGVHGHIEHPPADEFTPYKPGDAYQASKADGEKLVRTYFEEGKIQGSVIRPAMVYGPGDSRTLKLFRQIAHRRFAYVGPGDALVHFVDVRDLARVFRLAAESPLSNAQVYIAAGESSLPLNQLVSLISAMLGVRAPRIHLPVRPMQLLGTLCERVCVPLKIEPPLFRRRVDFFTKDRFFCAAKARRELGFEPAKTLIGELIDIIESYTSTGCINDAKLQKPSVILRTIDGQIDAWDADARAVYGWNKEQALGNVSHALLQTQFPRTLGDINLELQEKGLWEGVLLHKDKHGRDIRVRSTWRLLHLPGSSRMQVLEMNRPTAAAFVRQIQCVIHSMASAGSMVAFDPMW